MDIEGYKYVISAILLALLGYIAGGIIGNVVLWLGIASALFISFFFRDPERKITAGKGVVLSPADGRVVACGKRSNGKKEIAIFMSLFNVHVNRSPVSGEVTSVKYERGKFFVASKDEASEQNERNEITIKTEHGDIIVRQIAGFLARRIVCRVKAGDRLNIGERLGIIKFGSRVEVVLPETAHLMVDKGDRVVGGRTIIAKF